MSDLIEEIKDYAKKYDVPIMQDDGINFLTNFIKEKNINSVLELGTAIGYSAIMMANCNPNLKITTIERDINRYNEAVKNVKEAGLDDRITLIFKDALEAEVDDNFDLLFFDAAKAQNIKFLERYEKNLNKNGYIITDNMKFHGLVDLDNSSIKSRDLRQLVRKIKNYKLYLEENPNYKVEFLDIGDGIAIANKIN